MTDMIAKCKCQIQTTDMNDGYDWQMWMTNRNDRYDWQMWMTNRNDRYEWQILMTEANDRYDYDRCQYTIWFSAASARFKRQIWMTYMTNRCEWQIGKVKESHASHAGMQEYIRIRGCWGQKVPRVPSRNARIYTYTRLLRWKSPARPMQEFWVEVQVEMVRSKII